MRGRDSGGGGTCYIGSCIYCMYVLILLPHVSIPCQTHTKQSAVRPLLSLLMGRDSGRVGGAVDIRTYIVCACLYCYRARHKIMCSSALVVRCSAEEGQRGGGGGGRRFISAGSCIYCMRLFVLLSVV